jgi:hypothetical protein
MIKTKVKPEQLRIRDSLIQKTNCPEGGGQPASGKTPSSDLNTVVSPFSLLFFLFKMEIALMLVMQLIFDY